MNNWYEGLKELILSADSYNQFEAIEKVIVLLYDTKCVSYSDYLDLYETFETALFVYQQYKIAKGMNL